MARAFCEYTVQAVCAQNKWTMRIATHVSTFSGQDWRRNSERARSNGAAAHSTKCVLCSTAALMWKACSAAPQRPSLHGLACMRKVITDDGKWRSDLALLRAQRLAHCAGGRRPQLRGDPWVPLLEGIIPCSTRSLVDPGIASHLLTTGQRALCCLLELADCENVLVQFLVPRSGGCLSGFACCPGAFDSHTPWLSCAAAAAALFGRAGTSCVLTLSLCVGFNDLVRPLLNPCVPLSGLGAAACQIPSYGISALHVKMRSIKKVA
jgi:hypothetical protein